MAKRRRPLYTPYRSINSAVPHSNLIIQHLTPSAKANFTLAIPRTNSFLREGPVTLMLVDKLNGSGLIRPESPPESAALVAPYATRE